MTANLTIPADVWSCQQPGVPLVAAIVEGECAHCGPRVGWHHDLDCGGTQLVPPAWLVALRDARCRCVCHVVAPAQGVHCWDRCHDGRLLHDVRVEPTITIKPDTEGDPAECGHTNPVWWAPNDEWNAVMDPLDRRETILCSDCYRALATRTVRCLVDFVEVRAFPMLIGSHVVISGDEVWFWPNTDVRPLAVDTPSGLQFTDPDVLTPAHVDALAAACGKPPADWPGMYAVILTTTNQEAE